MQFELPYTNLVSAIPFVLPSYSEEDSETILLREPEPADISPNEKVIEFEKKDIFFGDSGARITGRLLDEYD